MTARSLSARLAFLTGDDDRDDLASVCSQPDHGTLYVLRERYNSINGAFDVGKGILSIDAGEKFDRD